MTVLEVIQRSTEFLTRKGVDSPRLQVELLLEIRDLLRAQQGMGPGYEPSGPGTTTLPGQL